MTGRRKERKGKEGRKERREGGKEGRNTVFYSSYKALANQLNSIKLALRITQLTNSATSWLNLNVKSRDKDESRRVKRAWRVDLEPPSLPSSNNISQ